MLWIVKVNSREFLLRVSYMEIYNEEINDLLAPEAQKLQIHESAEVHRMTIADFSNFQNALSMLMVSAAISIKLHRLENS